MGFDRCRVICQNFTLQNFSWCAKYLYVATVKTGGETEQSDDVVVLVV